MRRLEDKVILASGAGGGIGSAICRLFIQESTQMVATGIDSDATEEEFWRVVQLDLFGTWVACNYGIPRWCAATVGLSSP